MRPTGIVRIGLLATLAAVACGRVGEDRVLSVNAIASVFGFVYFDANGNRALDGGDVPQAGVEVRLVARGTRDTVARGRSDANGIYAVGVPVGDYRVVVDTTSLGDTVRVARVDTSEIRVGPGDTVAIRIAISYPRVSVQQARVLAPGRRVFVEGTALNGPALFGDTTVHLVDASGAVRATRIRPAPVVIGAGDSLRLLGRRGSRAGQPTLDDVTVFLLGVGLGTPPEVVTTAEATHARNGALDAALVRILNARVDDTTRTVRGDRLLVVDDGTGPLVMILDADAQLLTTGLAPGVVLEALGVLVPTGTGTFQLKPRFDSDLLRQ